MNNKIVIENLKNNLIKILFFLFFLKINPCIAKETLTLDYNNIKVFLEGNFIQGGLVKGKIDSNINVRFKGRLLRKTSKGFFVIGFGRDHPKIANLSIKINQNWVIKTFNIKKRVYKTQIINGLEKKLVTPPKSFYDRIIRENKAIKNIRNLDSDVDFIFQKIPKKVQKLVFSATFNEETKTICSEFLDEPNFVHVHQAEITPVSQISENSYKVCNLILDLSSSYDKLVRKKKAA